MNKSSKYPAILSWFYERLGLVFPILLLFLFFLQIAPFRHLWFDEVLTYFPITDPSLSHLIEVNRLPMNTMPPFYLALLWFGVKLVGYNELWLRVFSLLTICATLIIVWRLMRNRYGKRAAALGTLSLVIVELVICHSSEMRCYALYLFLSTLALYLCVLIGEKATMGRYIGLFLVTSLQLFTHTVGLLFSASLVLSQICYEIISIRRGQPITLRTFNLPLYASVLSAWIVFGILWGNVVLSQQKEFQNTTWVGVPDMAALLTMLLEGHRLSKAINFIPYLICGIGLYLHLKNRAHFDALNEKKPDFLLLSAFLIAFFPILFTYFYSQI